ncbi:MAG: hypothetical protein ACI8RZ_002026 [Myxococcota bacterium]|jgi:hypothetical protein
MASKADRPLIFLMAVVVSADVAPTNGKARPSSAKLKKMNAVLQHRFPDLSDDERWKVVGQALGGIPDIKDGVKLLTLVDKQARKLNTLLEGNPRRCRSVLKYLTAIASANDEITPQELRVIQTTARALGATDNLEVGEDEWGERTLKVA